MAVTGITSDTGEAQLDDVGRLAYNTVTFSSLFRSSMNGRAVKDAANRTTKYVEWTLEAQGVVTLGDQDTTDDLMDDIRILLSQDGGVLTYTGRGFGKCTVNALGGITDVAWGPKPELISFQPLGAGRGALVRWTCKTCLPEFPPPTQAVSELKAGGAKLATGAALGLGAVVQAPPGPVLQFNEEIDIKYDDEGYSSLSIRGTLEIPLTRSPGVPLNAHRDVQTTVDAWRQAFLDIQVDLLRYRVVDREFSNSRDKRTMEWSLRLEELAPMGLPFNCTHARGTYSVRPFSGDNAGLVNWRCSMRGTYTVRKDKPSRWAWAAFVSLLAFRMRQAEAEIVNEPAKPGAFPNLLGAFGRANIIARLGLDVFAAQLQNAKKEQRKVQAILVHFGFDEGLYLDSKTITFEATYRLVATFDAILRATGVWQWVDDDGTEFSGGDTWAASVRDVMGWRSWLANRVDPDADVVVDFGFGGRRTGQPPVKE